MILYISTFFSLSLFVLDGVVRCHFEGWFTGGTQKNSAGLFVQDGVVRWFAGHCWTQEKCSQADG